MTEYQEERALLALHQFVKPKPWYKKAFDFIDKPSEKTQFMMALGVLFITLISLNEIKENNLLKILNNNQADQIQALLAEVNKKEKTEQQNSIQFFADLEKQGLGLDQYIYKPAASTPFEADTGSTRNIFKQQNL